MPREIVDQPEVPLPVEDPEPLGPLPTPVIIPVEPRKNPIKPWIETPIPGKESPYPFAPKIKPERVPVPAGRKNS